MKRTKSKPTKRHAQSQLRKQPAQPEKLPFIAHIHELRKRLFYVAIAIAVAAGIAYAFEDTLTAVLLKPAGNQQFIYTSPGGGFDFLFKLVIYTGLAASIPVIVYHLMRYLQPLVRHETLRYIVWSTLASSLLAFTGILFGYFFGLPAAMRFLLQGFSSEQIEALISIQSYMSFVMVYLLGAALLFQVPLILILINRIKPLKPRKLMRYQKWVVITGFILGAIISPTPDIRNQLMLSIPTILMYELSIVIIWLINRKRRKPRRFVELLRKDAEARAQRLAEFEKARSAWEAVVQTSQAPSPPIPATSRPAANRPQQYVREFTRPYPKVLNRPAAQSDQ